MKSNVYQIQKGARVLDEIFVESEKVAVYNELNHKQTLQLRLLCEELVNMLPSIVSSFSGEFWIETRGDLYELCVSVSVEDMDMETRDRLIQVSKSRHNAAVVGISGKIRAVFDYMAMGGGDPMISPAGHYGFSTSIDFSQIWSLQQYRDNVEKDGEESPEWDEFERSIIVKIADDVIVGVKGKKVNIIIQKKFA